MRKSAPFLLPLLVAFCGTEKEAALPAPPGAEGAAFFPPGTDAAGLLEAVRAGLASPLKGRDFTRFLVVADGSRYGASFRPADFHAVVGAGVRLPAGSLAVQPKWNLANGANIDGRNEEPQTLGVTIAVERGAERPYAPEIVRAVAAFAAALAREAPIHPDCVVAMADIPYVNRSEAEEAERALAEEARRGVPVPRADRKLTVATPSGPVEVEVETCDTPNAIRTGMMLRRRFDGENRGMLFVYPHATYRYFYMRNCFIPIDLAYLRDGRIDEIRRMAPAAGVEPDRIERYESRAAIRLVLEMPAGWFERHGVAPGAEVKGLPE